MSSLAADPAGHLRPSRVVVGAVSFDPLTVATATAYVRDALGRGCGGLLLVVDRGLHRQGLGPELESATVVVAASATAVWASRLAGSGLPQRVTGIALAESLCAVAAVDGRQVYVIGGQPGGRGVPTGAQRVAAVWGLRHRGLRIAGSASPGPAPADRWDVAEVVEAKPDLVFVSAGPSGERIIAALRPELPSAWLIGCPGLVDAVLGGQVPTEPGPGALAMLGRGVARRLSRWLRRHP